MNGLRLELVNLKARFLGGHFGGATGRALASLLGGYAVMFVALGAIAAAGALLRWPLGRESRHP